MVTEPSHGFDPEGPSSRLPPRRSLVIAMLVGLAVAAVAVVAVTVVVARGDSPTVLETAKEECAAHTTEVRLGDGGRSMFVERVAAEDDEGASIAELLCIFQETNIPEAVISRMDSTRALDGREEAAWDGFTASWTYHPRSGLNIILEEQTD